MPKPATDNPNERYHNNNLGTWSSKSDVDSFFSRFNHANNYYDGTIKLGLGQYITDLYLGTLYMNQVKQAQKEEKRAQQQYNKNKKKKNKK